MWGFTKIFLILVLMKSCYAAPAASSERVETDPMLIAGYTEGDMILSKDRNGLISETYRWPNGTVYYYFNSDIDGYSVFVLFMPVAVFVGQFQATPQDRPQNGVLALAPGQPQDHFRVPLPAFRPLCPLPHFAFDCCCMSKILRVK
ncbi:hypothetical protein AWZ03_003738 [Drosophila navojoa]|uniref:Uncharacterized protein n=1 Tax=Drosophila navojoa TaxID=7232 RepID=A0A484BNX8_DRONA|nr:hypothetical protein AWZ03_003738 [Drosophila navojoa]